MDELPINGETYWVERLAGNNPEVAEWNNVYGWFFIGETEANRTVAKIGPRILPPVGM